MTHPSIKEALERLERKLPLGATTFRVVALNAMTESGIQTVLDQAEIPETFSLVAHVGSCLIFREDKSQEYLGLIETLQGLLLELENVLTLLPGESNETSAPE